MSFWTFNTTGPDFVPISSVGTPRQAPLADLLVWVRRVEDLTQFIRCRSTAESVFRRSFFFLLVGESRGGSSASSVL